MFLKHTLIFLTCVAVVLCEPLSVAKLPKCSIKDSECQRKLYQDVVHAMADEGFPEIGISTKIDPIILKDVSVSILDTNLTLVDGVAKGIKSCVFNKFQINIDTGFGTQEVTCDITIKGHYTLSGDSPLIKTLLGGRDGGIRGDGKTKLKLEKLFMTWNFPVLPEKRDDGEIIFRIVFNKIVYTFDVKGKATFAADNIFVGKENLSEFIINYLNGNWKYVMQTFGKVFVDKAMEFYFDYAKKFFEAVPARHYILEDMTPYLKN